MKQIPRFSTRRGEEHTSHLREILAVHEINEERLAEIRASIPPSLGNGRPSPPAYGRERRVGRPRGRILSLEEMDGDESIDGGTLVWEDR